MSTDQLIIRGAREHNLQNLSLELPRDRLIVFTGISGSGKSSLAFDTIYAEGQRRYVESLSAYARQFLGQMDKPDVDFIEGLSPAISIDQKTASRNPRSTVGTVTEIHDYLRLLYARIGIPHCPKCGREVARQTPQQIVDRVLELPEGTRFMVLAPVVRGRKGEYEALLADLAKDGFSRARIDGEIRELTEEIKLDRYVQHTIEVVVDRLVRREGIERRLSDSLETALHIAEGVAKVEVVEGPTLTFSQHLACAYDGTSFEELQPRNFSFNSPYGACQVCLGIGTQFQVDPDLVIPDPDLSIAGGAVIPWAGSKGRYFQRAPRGGRIDSQVRHRPAMGQTPPPGEAGGARRDRRPADQGLLHEPVRQTTRVHHQLRGCASFPPSPPLGRGERFRPRVLPGVHARGPVRRL